ncbi:MAG TPA: 30S ribosomal protein S16 [Thermoanaerobaculia bacterium]|nr:30S ribosomal protein S16 [Thermoanaerobaculia bacterium]
MLKIRLRRMGNRNRAFYRVVVSDARKVPTADAIDEVGYYDPTTEPATISLDEERVQYWVDRGAQVSATVAKLRGRSNVARATEPAAAEA